MLNKLKIKLKGKVILLGIGNPLRGDDGFGDALVKELEGKISLKVLEAGSTPENFLSTIIKEKPNTVLFIDAVDFGGNVAEMRLWNLKEIKTKNLFFTHNSSLNLIFSFLKENTQANFYLLAIQPKSIKFQNKMSLEVQNRLEELKTWFQERYGICA
jgi:hydrogenase 3 maturation protease